MSRTPEETARLASTVAVIRNGRRVDLEVDVLDGVAHVAQPPVSSLSSLFAIVAADLAEARAEVAALKAEVESLAAATFAGVREKQAARIATLERELAEARAALEAETQRRCELGAAYHEEVRRHADTESELAEARAEVAALRDDRDRFAMLKCCEMAGAMVTALGIRPPGEDAVANWRAVCDAAEQMAEAARQQRDDSDLCAKTADEIIGKMQADCDAIAAALGRPVWTDEAEFAQLIAWLATARPKAEAAERFSRVVRHRKARLEQGKKWKRSNQWATVVDAILAACPAEEPREVVDECGLLDPAVCRDCGTAVTPPLKCAQCGSLSWRAAP